ncbi:MAG: Fe-S cluster assembly protein SufD [Chloroflexota bacterium]|nr:Fe-S cluster assembly protein SufD [Lentimicrobium sp.]
MEEIILNIKDALEDHYRSNQTFIGLADNPRISALRREAIDVFASLGFPDTKQEKWRNTDLSKVLERSFSFPVTPQNMPASIDQLFKCEVPGFDTLSVTVLNGWYVNGKSQLTRYDNGMIVGSLRAAFTEFPELIEKHYGRYADFKVHGLAALNTALAMDGVFIYVPDNVVAEKTLQMVSVINMHEDSMIHLRNLIILGKNSKLRLVQCDDSIDDHRSFINTVSEFYLDENASLDHYKLQNKNDRSALLNISWFNLERSANLSSNGISLNGGFIRNESYVKLAGSGSNADIFGLYLMDRGQHIDNQVFIDHATPDCTSNELFKGILDDNASGVFNGHILVRPDAQRTNAYQNNKNILISDKAVIDTKPFLEIYADDVKCSHGATVGQLDQEAMFYIRSRGISYENARMLLMYAFAAEIVNKISIEELRMRIDDLVKKRLRGELSICDQCVLHCNAQEQRSIFKIDMSRI